MGNAVPQALCLAHTLEGEAQVDPPFSFDRVVDAMGNPTEAHNGKVRLSGDPCYFLNVTMEKEFS